MSKILLINPSKWGRGITPIWAASHSGILKSSKHNVQFFDSTFYKNWTNNEVKFNTENKQYRPSNYFNKIKFKNQNVKEDLKNILNEFEPDIIFWSAISSHIHGEGEYVNVQYGYELIENLKIDNALIITGGLQATASPEKIFENYKNINFIIKGESEKVLLECANKIDSKNYSKKEKVNIIKSIKGISYIENSILKSNERQEIISNLDTIGMYDYSIFEDQIFLRPYNGDVIKAVDYELSRGCVFTCSYCVETIIQKYYGFEENKRGVLTNAKSYIRNKSAKRIFDEFKDLSKKFKINLIRCQDTNFLTINRDVLKELAELMKGEKLNVKLYIETRPEGINEFTVSLLQNLNVDGVGMGLEVSSEGFREESLNRYANQNKIRSAFKLLREKNIKRTAYNIIGLPNQTEEMIKETIKFNQELKPDNITVAYYSPYYGTIEQKKSEITGDFQNYEQNVDGQLRSLSKSNLLSVSKLDYYKKNFYNLVYGEKN